MGKGVEVAFVTDGEDATPAIQATIDEAHREIIHRCPIGDSNIMPCCNRTPWEIPMTDRMTVDPKLVTCRVAHVN
jgi:hypothetical protein